MNTIIRRLAIPLIAVQAILACDEIFAQSADKPRTFEQIFRELDKNGDGKLTREESANPGSFDAADADKDGRVTPDELRLYLAARQRPRVPSKTPIPAAETPRTTPPPVDGVPVLKSLPDADAVRDAAGTGQLFECVHVPGITDLREGMNGFALADLNRDGRPDMIAMYSPPATNRTTRLVVLLNQGGFRFTPHAITIGGSKFTMEDFGPAAQIPNLADFNGDGFLDLIVSRSSTTTGGQNRRGLEPPGITFLVSDGAWDRFVDVSQKMGARNELGYNRQTSIGDVNGDGWLDFAVGCDNIKNAHGGLPHSRLYVFQPNGPGFLDGRFADIGGSDLVPDFGGFYHDSARDKAGPGISLRDLDNDGDLDLVQSYHVDVRQPMLPYWPGEYRQGVMCWKNLLLSVLCAPVVQVHAQTAAPDALFTQRDKDADGKLNAEELGMPNLFGKLDKNNDGSVSKEEFTGFYSKRGGKAAPISNTPADPNLKPRTHGDEAAKAKLKPDVLAKLDLALQQAIANKEISGVIGLIHRNGQRGYFEAFGMQDIEAQKPLAKDALFRLQSMTKPVIAACAMSLFDAGLFTLDEPISKHCPEWAEPKVLENGQLVPAKFAITPRMLMSHSSGLYYGNIEKGALSKKGNEGAKFTPVATTSRDANTTLKSFSEGLAKAPLKFHPGASYQYGHSIDVLGRYIEAVAGKPLDQVLQERILGPLKMTSTDFWVHPENAGRICQIYKQPKPGVLERGREASQLTEKPTLFLGGQGLISSTEDYERFCRMMMNRGELDGARVLKAETIDLMFQNHLKPELGQKYGLGGAVDGEGGYSWGGANGTQFWLDRKNNLFGIYMVQTQLYKAPTYGTFKSLANESAGITSTRGMAPQGQDGGASALTTQFKQRDKNNDGKLSRDELPAALFDRLDADKDGFVIEEELKALRQPN